MKKNICNVGILGAGYMGQNHARVLSSLEDVNFIAVCDKDFEKAEEISKQYKVKSYKSFQKLIEEENLDAVIICLPTTLHFEAAICAIRKGMAVFIEKPVCSTVKEAKSLIKKARKVPIMVGHIERFNPVVSEIKQRIKSGELGKVLKIHTQRFSPPTGRAGDVSAIIDLATHDIDIIQYLLGNKPIRIYAETQNSYHNSEDLMSALIRFKDGAIGLIEVSWLHPIKTRNLTVMGEKGMYVANYLTQELFFYRQNKSLFRNNFFPPTSQTRADVIKIAFEAKEPLRIELESFFDALRSKTQMPVTAKDGLLAIQTAEYMALSGFDHKIIK